MKVFIADYLPLKNKGEEAILRGLESLFSKKYNEDIEFCVLDVVDKPEKIGNVGIIPSDCCYPDFSNPRMRGFKGSVKMLLICCLTILGLYPYRRRVKKNILPILRDYDKILLAHDGFMNPFCAALGIFLHKYGVVFSVIGAGFVPVQGKLRWFYKKVYSSFFNKASLVVLREETAFEYVKGISSSSNVYLLPDPAFNSKIDTKNNEKANCVLGKYGFNREHLNFGVTVCENSISFSTAFRDSLDKQNEHREFIAGLLDSLAEKLGCNFYFLPHCIENGAGDDLAIARDVVKRIKLHQSNVFIITDDLPVMDIKGVISNMDMIIGERTHSIINSISCGVPFINLTCSADIRSHDIIDKDCGLGDYIIDLDNPVLNDVITAVINVIDNREKVRTQIEKTNRINDNKFDSLINRL